MAEIDVIWRTFNPDAIFRGYWDQGILEDMFKDGDFVHHKSPASVRDGAIYIINGRMHYDYLKEINADIAKLRWVLFIETGDEEAGFDWRAIKHPVMRVWIQLPRMNQHNDVSFHLPNGYRAGTLDVLKDAGIRERVHDVTFIGQVNHDRREQCVEALEKLSPDDYSTVLMPTKGFGQEALNQEEYMATLAQSKIVLCPSGVESPDTFRLYEALEAGCIPIVDAFASRNTDWGFWNYLFKENVPFPIISYWDRLPDLLPELLKNYPENANKCFSWWQNYKRDMKFKLIDDVRILSR